MAPKHHPTPLSGGDRKALNKELGKARAMANILASQSAEMRAKGEALNPAGRQAALRKLERTHVGFRLADHDGMRRKLDGLGIPYSRMELPELGERHLFIRTPTKILLELVFRDTKAASPSTHQEQTNDQ
jgi:hypothetical protein